MHHTSIITRQRTRSYSIPPHHHYLSDYVEMIGSSWDDDCAEQCAWPDLMDQTQLERWCRNGAHEDAEDDDPAGGDICDEPHDARDEDGI